MPEYRLDQLTGRIVIVAEERASRPHQFDIEQDDRQDGDSYRSYCPFCEGNELMTPGEISAFRHADSPPDGPGWTVRTIPNLYPAVVRGGEESPIVPTGIPSGVLQSSVPGFGAHEVIVDTPRHLLSVADMTETEVEAMLRMYAVRLQSLRSEKRFASAIIFKNVGQAAGASLPHAHSQLIALPFPPESLRIELDRAKTYADGTTCLWCDMLAGEFRDGRRIVEDQESFVALCPFVSRFPAEIAIYPKHHQPFFEDQTDAEHSECARLIRRTIRRLEQSTPWIKGRLAYNMILHTGPLLREQETVYHFHFSILPSLSRAAGFEWGTGLHINPIAPETAAARLRDAFV